MGFDRPSSSVAQVLSSKCSDRILRDPICSNYGSQADLEPLGSARGLAELHTSVTAAISIRKVPTGDR